MSTLPLHLQTSRMNHSCPNTTRLIEQKINALLHSRRIKENLTYAGISVEKYDWFKEGYRRLQYSIYELDVYGESYWDIQDSTIGLFWDEIYNHLQFFEIKSERLDPVLCNMRSYQAIEIDQRNGELSLEIPLHTIYHLKACDVRLTRSIIFELGNPPSSRLLAMWNYFDLISEVCDDLADIVEDSLTHNYNRFLIESALHGGAHVKRIYRDLIRKLELDALHLLSQVSLDDRSASKEIYKWVYHQARIAESLLELSRRSPASRHSIRSDNRQDIYTMVI